MADANGATLTQFLRWYEQPRHAGRQGAGNYDAAAQTYTLTLTQISGDANALPC